jgi:hypothetical protein
MFLSPRDLRSTSRRADLHLGATKLFVAFWHFKFFALGFIPRLVLKDPWCTFIVIHRILKYVFLE